jgi:hypothetical protein
MVRGTADPSTTLRFGRDDKGEGGASREDWLVAERVQQVPPLRFAPVGMTLLFVRFAPAGMTPLLCWELGEEQQGLD